jgi:hypothetical protein
MMWTQERALSIQTAARRSSIVDTFLDAVGLSINIRWMEGHTYLRFEGEGTIRGWIFAN